MRATSCRSSSPSLLSAIRPSKGKAVTLTPQKWVVCEQSGRWTAALRIAFARLPKAQSPPRLYEVRTLGELSMHLDEQGRDLALIEVGLENLVGVVQLLMRRGPRLAQFVALLEDCIDQRHLAATIPGESDVQLIVDLLWEVGVAEVVESPRRLRGLLALHDRLTAARGSIPNMPADRQAFAKWAWSTLPWQDP
jgi:hypothetical protein